jgi:hypothetical protein
VADGSRRLMMAASFAPSNSMPGRTNMPTKKTTRGKSTPKSAKPKIDKTPSDTQLSAIDAAAKVLAEEGEPLNTKQMIDAMAAKGYWTSPGGKTPHATLYSAILREIKSKGENSRFTKVERGKFTRTN